jgi:ribosomal protein L29
MIKMEDIRAMSMRRRVHMGEMQNTRTLRTKRRELARMLTVLSEQLSKENA